MSSTAIPRYLRIKAYRCETDPSYKGPRYTTAQVREKLQTEIVNSPFFYKHKYGGRRQLGQVADGWIDKNGWLNLGILTDIQEDNEYAVKAMEDITSGRTDSFSIGYLMTPQEDGSCHKEWLEVSAVDNPDLEGSGGRPTMIVCHSKGSRKERRIVVPIPRDGGGIYYDGERPREVGKKRSREQKKTTDSMSSLFEILAKASASSTSSSSTNRRRRSKMSTNKRSNKKTDTRMEDADDSGSEEELSDQEMMDVSGDESDDAGDYTFGSGNKKKKKSAPAKKKKGQQKRAAKKRTEAASDDESSSDEEENDSSDDEAESEDEKTMSSTTKKSTPAKKKENLRDRRRRAVGEGRDPRKEKAGDDNEDLFLPLDLQKQIDKMSEDEKAAKIAALTMKLGDVTEAQRRHAKERKKEQQRLAELEEKEKLREKKYSRKRGREADEVKDLLMKQGVITEETPEETVNEFRALFTSRAGERMAGLLSETCSSAAKREAAMAKELRKAQRRNKKLMSEYERVQAEREGFEPIEDFPLNPHEQQQVLVQHSRNRRSKTYSKLLGVANDDVSDDDMSSEDDEPVQKSAPKRRRVGRDEQDYSFIDPQEARRSTASGSIAKRKTRGSGGKRKAFLRPKEMEDFEDRMGLRGRRFMNDSLRGQNPGLFNLLMNSATAQSGMGDLPPVDKRTLKRFGRRNPYTKADLGSDDDE